MYLKRRLRNYGLWVSVGALVLLLLQQFGVDISPDKYNTMLNSILGILTMLGILNNPTTDCKGFGDDKETE